MASLRMFLWRWQWPLAIAYLALLGLVAGGLWFYHKRVPHSLDTGLTVALRSVAYRATFAEFEAAKRDFDAGLATVDPLERDRLFERTEIRLERYLAQHPTLQPDRLHTHAIVASTQLLAELETRRGKSGRPVRLLEAIAASVPLEYRIQQLLGRAYEAAGDMDLACAAYREAFKLAPNRAEVVDDYVGLLAELTRFADIAFVADHHESAVRTGKPSVEVKVGPARSSIQRRILGWSGVPVEHGSYPRAVTLFGLERGAKRTLSPPQDLLAEWTHGGPLYVQLRFENVYEGLEIHAFRYWTHDGRMHDHAVDGESLATSHRAYSGVEFYVELRTDLDPVDVARFEFDYSMPEERIASGTAAVIERARINLEGLR